MAWGQGVPPVSADKNLCDGWNAIDGIVLGVRSSDIIGTAKSAGWTLDSRGKDPSKDFGCLRIEFTIFDDDVRMYIYSQPSCLQQLKAYRQKLMTSMKNAGKHTKSKAADGGVYDYVTNTRCNDALYAMWYCSPIEAYEMQDEKSYGFYCGITIE